MTVPKESIPSGRDRAVGISERAYRALLRAYPRAFRDEFGGEMSRCFRDLRRDALADGGGVGLAALWLRTVPDLLSTAMAERGRVVLARNAYRVGVGLALATAFLLVWVNLAVGIIGSEDNPANLMYFGMLAAGIGGAVAVRFRAHGMARALVAVAIAQALVPVIALAVGRPELTLGVLGVLVGNAFFVVLWVGSALLFRYAAQAPAHGGPGPQG